MKIFNINIYRKVVNIPKKFFSKKPHTRIDLAGLSSQKALNESALSLELQELLEHFKEKHNFKKKKPVQWAIKRTFDYAGATVGLIITSPIILASAVLIKLETKGPAIFKQVRIGKNGKPFVMYKLRTMHFNPSESYKHPAVVNDKRVTKIGKILRKFSIDEFPQFLNVLKGDMSLVGPRPIPKNDLDKMLESNPNSVRQLVVKPGARLAYKSSKVENSERISTEKQYFEKWSLLEEMKHLSEIVKRILIGKNY